MKSPTARQTTIILPAGRDAGLQLGSMMTSADGKAIYRIEKVGRLRRAGEKTHRLRLTCTRINRRELPEGTDVLPWSGGARTPKARFVPTPRSQLSSDPGIPEAAAARLDRLRAKVPLLLNMAIKAIREARIADEVAQLARAARVGQDDGVQHGRDYGPGIRLTTVRARRRRGETLRLADVEIEDGADPDHPNRTLRRARRADPLRALKKAGTITKRDEDAAEQLRGQLEAAQASIPCAGQSEIHVSAFERVGTSDRQVNNCTWVRRALGAVTPLYCPVLLWVLLGGSVSGFASFTGLRHTTAAERLKKGLNELADHYYGTGGDRQHHSARVA